MIVIIMQIIVMVALISLLIVMHKKHPLLYGKSYSKKQWIWHFIKMLLLVILFCTLADILIAILGPPTGILLVIITALKWVGCFLIGYSYPIYPQKIWGKKNVKKTKEKVSETTE